MYEDDGVLCEGDVKMCKGSVMVCEGLRVMGWCGQWTGRCVNVMGRGVKVC